MRQPPRYELYDLFADPYEFNDLAEDSHHREIFLTSNRHCMPGVSAMILC